MRLKKGIAKISEFKGKNITQLNLGKSLAPEINQAEANKNAFQQFV